MVEKVLEMLAEQRPKERSMTAELPEKWRPLLAEITGLAGSDATREAAAGVLRALHRKRTADPRVAVENGAVRLFFDGVDFEIRIAAGGMLVRHAGESVNIGRDHARLGDLIDEANGGEDCPNSVPGWRAALYCNSPDYEFGVVRDPARRSGIPCIKGTRIGVYEVAGMVANSSVEAVLAGYDGLNRDMVEKSVEYAREHPETEADECG